MMDYILSNSHRAIFICKLIAKTGFNIGQCQGTSVYRPYTRNLCCPAFASQSNSQITIQHSSYDGIAPVKVNQNDIIFPASFLPSQYLLES